MPLRYPHTFHPLTSPQAGTLDCLRVPLPSHLHTRSSTARPWPGLIDVPRRHESPPAIILLSSRAPRSPLTQTGTRSHEACASIGARAGAHLWSPRRFRCFAVQLHQRDACLRPGCCAQSPWCSSTAPFLASRLPTRAAPLNPFGTPRTLQQRLRRRCNSAYVGITRSACAVPHMPAPWTFESATAAPAGASMLA